MIPKEYWGLIEESEFNIERTYKIQEYVEGFVAFINHHGAMRLGHEFQSYKLYLTLLKRENAHLFVLTYPVILEDTYNGAYIGDCVGELFFTFLVEPDGLLTVTAIMVPFGPVKRPLSEAGLQYLEDLDKAILEKYPLMVRGKTLSTAAPPWDRLADKAEWTPDDWLYFFDFYMPDESFLTGFTPNYKKLEALTLEFCCKRKTASTIKRKFYEVYKNRGNGELP